MDTLPFRQSPTSPEESLLRRLYRLFAILERLQKSVHRAEPATARDLRGVHGILTYIAVSIESQLVAGRPRTWEDAEARAKRPPASFPLLLRLLAVTRKAASAVIVGHDDLQEDGGRCCCWLCDDVQYLRWFLGTSRRLLSAAQHTHP
jgi:hypothetical protein